MLVVLFLMLFGGVGVVLVLRLVGFGLGFAENLQVESCRLEVQR